MMTKTKETNTYRNPSDTKVNRRSKASTNEFGKCPLQIRTYQKSVLQLTTEWGSLSCSSLHLTAFHLSSVAMS